VRNISHSLSPPGLDLFGLEFTLQELFDNFNAAGIIQVHFENETGKTIDALDKKTALALFRVIQELLSNTVKHAGAKNVFIKFFASDKAIVLTYNDDGKGLVAGSDKKPGMGTQNIEARLRMIQANFEIGSEEKKGFFIKIIMPQNN
jgi:signal transduction histidine kinase